LYPMKSDMNTRNSNKFYHFYHDNDHDTDVCHALKKRDWLFDLEGVKA
jgi:hypothetical protein